MYRTVRTVVLALAVVQIPAVYIATPFAWTGELGVSPLFRYMLAVSFLGSVSIGVVFSRISAGYSERERGRRFFSDATVTGAASVAVAMSVYSAIEHGIRIAETRLIEGFWDLVLVFVTGFTFWSTYLLLGIVVGSIGGLTGHLLGNVYRSLFEQGTSSEPPQL